MFSKVKGYDEITSSSDEDEAKSLKEVFSEKSPLVVKQTPVEARTSTQQDVGREPHGDTFKGTQYFAALVVTIGGFIVGTTVGWSSPAGPLLENNHYGFNVTEENVSWIAALVPFGALLGCPAIGGLVDKLGRKNMMIILTAPTFIGWAMIIWAQSVVWIYVGRILTGFASGSYSVIVPLYTSEIADKEIRGTLGNYFQLQVNLGILFIYILGCYFDVFGLSVACAIVPLIYLCFLVLIPESPFFYLMKGDVDNARLSLRFFRGRLYNIEPELNTMQKSLAKTERERVPTIEAFQTKPAKRGLIVGLGSMFFQQFTGCNAIIFYATAIFTATGSKIQSSTSTVIVGVMAVISTYISTLVVDKLGRKILLLFSVVSMGICTFLIGGFFYLKDSNYNISSIAFIPLVSLCIFIIAFSIGFGPIPWMMIGEIFPAQIKGISSSIVCMSNWFFAFLVTKFFLTLVSAIFIYNTFFLFTFFSLLGIFFVILIVPETKGKTMEEIQLLLGADPVLPENIENQNEIQG